MGFNYEVNTSKNNAMARNALHVCHICFNIINLFISTFFIAYIHEFNTTVNSYIFNVCIYKLVDYSVFMIVYLISSPLVDKTNRVNVFRLSIVIETAIVISFIFFGKELATMVAIAGILQGLFEGTYYASYNVIKNEMVNRKKMNSYSTISVGSVKVIGIIFPIIFGTLIDISSFSRVAIIVAVIALLQFMASFWIKSQKPSNSNFSIKKYLSRLKSNPSRKKIYLLYIMCSLYGSLATIETLINVFIMAQFGSNFSFGALTSLFAILSVLSLALFQKFSKSGKRTALYYILAITPIICGLMFALFMNKPTLIINYIGFSVSSIIYKCMIDVYRNGTLKESGLYSDITEHHAIVETIFSLSRIFIFALILVSSLFNSLVVFRILFVIIIAISSVIFILLTVYEKDLTKSTENLEKALE